MSLVNPNADYEEQARKKFFEILSANFKEMKIVNEIVESLGGFLPCNLTDITKLLLLLLYRQKDI